MRHVLLASVAIGSILGGAGVVQAAGLVPMDLMFAHPYAEFGGGLNFTSVTLTDLQSNCSFCTPTATQNIPLGIGSAIYGTIGAELSPGLRAELQASLRNNGGAHFNVSAEGSGAVGVSAQTFMLLANIWKDFDLSNGLSFHIGGGLGVGDKTLTVTGATPTLQSVAGLAFLAGAGADYKLSNNMTLTFNYSVSGVTGNFGRSTIASSYGGEVLTGQLGKGLDQTATIGLRIALAP